MIRPLPKPIRVLKLKRRKKKTSRVLLEREADKITREIVLDRDGYCVCPAPKKGHSSILQCGHLISRARKSVRWDLRNCNVNCASCNFIHEHHPEKYTRVFLAWYGQAEYEKLCDEGDVVRKIPEDELEAMVSELTSIRRRQLDRIRDGVEYKPRFTQKEILSGEWRKYENWNNPQQSGYLVSGQGVLRNS